MTTRYGLAQQLGHPVPDRDDRDWVFSTELEREAGITYRQLEYWTRTGLLEPIHADITPGSGHIRRYPADQVHRATVLRGLMALGFSLQVARTVIDDLLADGRIDHGPFTLTLHRPDTANGDAA